MDINLDKTVKIDNERADASDVKRTLHSSRLLKAIAPFSIEVGLTSLLINICGLLMPLFSLLIYDKVVGNGNVETLWALTVGMVLVLFLEFILRMIRGYTFVRLGVVAEVKMNGRFIDRILQTNASQIASPGFLMSRYRDQEGARDTLFSQYIVVASDLPFLLLFLIIQGFIFGTLVIIPLLFSLLLLTGQWFISRSQRNYHAHHHVSGARKTMLLADIVASLAFLQTSPLRYTFADRWENEVHRDAIVRNRQHFLQTFSQSLAALCLGMASVALLVLGVYRIQAGVMSVGLLIACSLIQLRIMLQLSSAISLVMCWKDLNRTQTELDRASTPEVFPVTFSSPMPDIVEMSVLDLTCCDHSGGSYLDAVNLHIKPGERVAIIGRPGSGKSTLLRCLAGVQLPDKGQVLINGMRIQAYAADDRMNWLAYKSQEPVIVGPTLQDNLADLQGERAECVLECTGLKTLLRNGEMRRDQIIQGAECQPLSCGQRQIVALARTLATDARIFLLDEPTSGLDAETESKLVNAVEKLTRNRTVVLATHSIALLNKMDKIVILERGKVVAFGPREQLLRSSTTEPVIRE